MIRSLDACLAGGGTATEFPGGHLFFFNDTATTEIYTLSLHDALPISRGRTRGRGAPATECRPPAREEGIRDRKSTRLNSSHSQISYAVFCLKKKCDRRTNTSASGGPGAPPPLRLVPTRISCTSPSRRS